MIRLLPLAAGLVACGLAASARPVVAAADPAAAARTGDVLLLDFAAAWCGPCKQMAPIVAEVERAGWIVRHIDVDREADLVRRFGITGVPCYVLLVKGHEVGRINGATTRGELEQLLATAAAPLGGTAPPAATPAADPAPVPGVPLPVASAATHLATDPPATTPIQPADPARAAAAVPVAAVERAAVTPPLPQPPPTAGRTALEQRLLTATARLRVEDSSGVSWATGTVIDCRQGEALILTCGHVFRDSEGKGRIEVDLFGPQGPRGVAGQVISWDLKRDLALVSIFTEATIDPVRVGGTDSATPVGASVVTVGCNGGKDPTIHHSRITAVDKYLGPSNLQVAGQPVQGRSGGGLFAIDGTLIGVCNAADPADNEGLFAALPSIHDQLDEAGLTFVYRTVYPSGGLEVAAAGPRLPNMPAEMPSVSFDRRDRADAVPTASTGEFAESLGGLATPAAIPAAMPAVGPVADTPTAGGRAAPEAATLSAGEAALIDHVRQQGGKAEVICIVRPHGATDASSEVFVLKGARPDFVDHLSRAHHGRAPSGSPPAEVRSDVALLPTSGTTR